MRAVFADEAEGRDAERSHMLEAHGFEVLRFGNTAILTDMEWVVATIFVAVSRKLDGMPRVRE